MNSRASTSGGTLGQGTGSRDNPTRSCPELRAAPGATGRIQRQSSPEGGRYQQRELEKGKGSPFVLMIAMENPHPVCAQRPAHLASQHRDAGSGRAL